MRFEEACRKYVYRFTMDHVPAWAKTACEGKFYAPQYKSDREWFDRTAFPPNNPFATSKHDTSCYSGEQSWPLGHWLEAPYERK